MQDRDLGAIIVYDKHGDNNIRQSKFMKSDEEILMFIDHIVDIYIRKIRSLAQKELDYFRNQPSLNIAIHNAALAINRDGKRYSHQRRLSNDVLQTSKDILSANLSMVSKVNSFEELHDLLTSLIMDISGIGPLYVYDTSLRLGAYLGLSPKRVYLHVGTSLGARALGLDTNRGFLNVDVFPASFTSLEPHEIEDLLCIFKDGLMSFREGDFEEEHIRRSRHC